MTQDQIDELMSGAILERNVARDALERAERRLTLLRALVAEGPPKGARTTPPEACG